MTVRDAPRPALPPDACLDFINTRYWRGKAEPTETLHGAADLVAWAARHAGAPTTTPGPGLFSAGIALRELLHRIMSARAAGESVTEADLAALDAALEAAPARRSLVAANDGYAWRTRPAGPEAGEPHASGAATLLAPILWAAADLLAQGAGSGERLRLRACANPECRWLFIDASRNGSRRWCDMAACGNRAKAHRHYLRAKAAKG
ncbi:MAG: CGNR zinc finger domain-containing protein [Rhodospirillales bacterium]|jgi:predicted RNA-binding Zn ribbon-like protein|nr:CGNR zinc finger domain-containing protein [Rhodospirillales bacterium]